MFSLVPSLLCLSPRLPPLLPPGHLPSGVALSEGGRIAPPTMLLSPVVMGEGTGAELAFYSLPVPLDKVLMNLEGRASEHPLAAAVEEDACALLGAAGLGDGEQLSLTLCDDDIIRALNSEWRSVDRPTDVLSFPMEDEQLLGDLVVSVETANRQATERSHTLRDELRILMVHGLLHLLGYDHEESDDAHAEMAAAERKLLSRLGWRGEGLIDAASALAA